MTSAAEFREFGKAMIDYVADYMEEIRDRPVKSNVNKGYLKHLIPSEAPETPQDWKKLLSDVENVIMPGVTHWQSPHFHAFYPVLNSYPAIVADILANAIGCNGLTWLASPACAELEMNMMDWTGKMLKLPDEFLFSSGRGGGGIILGSASEANLQAMMCARSRVLGRQKEEDATKTPRVVAYTSKVAHCSVERAGLLLGITVRQLETDKDFSLRGETVSKAMAEDREKGLIPCCVIATLGTTACCSYDNLLELGPVCRAFGIWLHVDAAYAGAAFICPEYRPILNGVEYVDSFNFNAHKWLMVNIDCSLMWVRNSAEIVDAFKVDPLYLRSPEENSSTPVPEYRHWSLSIGRRFRSLKLWFVFSLYGQEKLREHIRNHISLAHEFEKMIEDDEIFEIVAKVTLGLVCFRLKGSNEKNKKLIENINESGKIFMIPSQIDDSYFLRFVVSSRMIRAEDIEIAFKSIKDEADKLCCLDQ